MRKSDDKLTSCFRGREEAILQEGKEWRFRSEVSSDQSRVDCSCIQRSRSQLTCIGSISYGQGRTH